MFKMKMFRVASTSEPNNIDEAVCCWIEFITSAKKRELKMAFRLNDKREIFLTKACFLTTLLIFLFIVSNCRFFFQNI